MVTDKVGSGAPYWGLSKGLLVNHTRSLKLRLNKYQTVAKCVPAPDFCKHE